MSGAKDDSPDLYRPGRQSNQSNPSNPSNPSNSRPQDQTSQRPRQAQTKALPLRQVSLPSDDEDLDAGAGGGVDGGGGVDREEVKLSHQIVPDNSTVAAQLQKQFVQLNEQIKEYARLNHLANEKAKASEARVEELEQRAEELEEEARVRESQIDQGQGYGVGAGVGVGVGVGGGLRLSRQAQANIEANKRTEQLRRALLSGDGEESSLGLDSEQRRGQNNMQLFMLWVKRVLPFKRDLHMIQARYGSAVSSYFIFQRTVFLKMSFIALCMLVVAVYHLIVLSETATTLSDYISGDGYLPYFMNFSSFSASERFLYSTVVVVTMMGVALFLCIKLVREHRMAATLDAFDAENLAPFSKELLCAWDNSLVEPIDIDEYRGKHEHTFLQLLEDYHETGMKEVRSNFESFVNISRRVLGSLLYLCVVGASFTAIIALTIFSTAITNATSTISGLRLVGPFIGPLALTGINAVVPKVLGEITKMERWDSAQTELKLLLLRVYLSSTLNTLILALSYIMLVDPFLLAMYESIRNALELPPSDLFTCRVDQAADALYVLAGSTFVVQLAFFGLTPWALKQLARLRGKPWQRTEFNVAENMVKKFSFLGLVFVSFPFSPLSLLFVPLYMAIGFKSEKYLL
ncbi:hypothetical protein B484DRAFT_326147, partial [Ochromonadaceae sp. CCMP2298]